MAPNHDEFFNEDAWYRKNKIKLTLKLYKCQHLSRQEVYEVLNLFNDFITDTLKMIKQKSKKLKKKGSDEILAGLDVILYEERNPFKNLLTEDQRFEIYQKQCSYLDPIPFTVALKDDLQRNTQVRIKPYTSV